MAVTCNDPRILVGKQLVVRMQYDDNISVGQCEMDNVLDSIVQVSHPMHLILSYENHAIIGHVLRA